MGDRRSGPNISLHNSGKSHISVSIIIVLSPLNNKHFLSDEDLAKDRMKRRVCTR